jgi:hypothetical protein
MNSPPTSIPDENIKTNPTYRRVEFDHLVVDKYYYVPAGGDDIDIYKVTHKGDDSIQVIQYFPPDSPGEQGTDEGEYTISKSDINNGLAMYEPASVGGSRKTRRNRRTRRRKHSTRRNRRTTRK